MISIESHHWFGKACLFFPRIIHVMVTTGSTITVSNLMKFKCKM